jgi:hypothetical protein
MLIDDPRRHISPTDARSEAQEQLDSVADAGGSNLESAADVTRSTVAPHGEESPTLADVEVRAFLARILGWSDDRGVVVDRAHRSVQLAAGRHAALVLCGKGDLVPLAAALHKRTLGPNAPFIVCDPRRGNAVETVRSPANRTSGIDAIAAASGGTICMRASRLPRDFAAVIERVREPDAHVQTVVCWGQRDERNPLLVVPAPIVVPALRGRVSELLKIIDAYALDAIAALATRTDCFTDADRAWVAAHASDCLAQIEKATLRVVAIRISRNLSAAAARLDMAPVSLSRWFARRPTLTPTTAPCVARIRIRLGTMAGRGDSTGATPPTGGAAQGGAPMLACAVDGDE